MSSGDRKDEFVEKDVTYALFKDGQFYIVENVPARVDAETGEQYFSPKTVEYLHEIILERRNLPELSNRLFTIFHSREASQA